MEYKKKYHRQVGSYDYKKYHRQVDICTHLKPVASLLCLHADVVEGRVSYDDLKNYGDSKATTGNVSPVGNRENSRKSEGEQQNIDITH